MKDLLIKRSKLYNLEPIGFGSKYVESLTSFIIRIAYEHNITVGDLIKKMIAPHINKNYLIRSSLYGGNRFYEGAKTINGYMENSFDLVKAMEELTTRSDLNNLTLNKLRDFIPLRNLLKGTLSWCPECIKYGISSSTVYYPLIWHISMVNTCIIHNCSLMEHCPSCIKRVDILRREVILGYCPSCFSSLSLNPIKKPDSRELTWQNFIVENIGELLTLDNSIIHKETCKERVLHQFELIIQKNFLGNMSNFSKYLNIPKSTVHYWLSNRKLPALETLLQICFKLNKKISDLLFEPKNNNGNIFQIDEPLVVNLNDNKSRKPLNLVAIEQQLVELFKSNPPISMSAVAKRIGHDKRTLYKNSPNLCKQISGRYKKFVDNRSNQRIEKLKTKINNAFISLVNQGIYPSRRKIEETTQIKGLLKEKVLQGYWKDLLAQNSLEFKKRRIYFDDESK